MEVVNVNQWNNDEVEEISLQRKSVVQHSSNISSSSNNSDNYNIEVKGLDFIESETKPEFEVVIKERNAEMIIQQEDIIESDSILPASDPPLVEDSTNSLINVTNAQNEKFIIVEKNGEERQEFDLDKVFEKPPTHGFYCPNCNVCIQKVYIQKIYIQQQEPDNIRCSSCFSFLIPIGSWLFPGLISNDDSLEIGQSVGRGTLKSVTKIEDESGKQTLRIIEQVVTDELAHKGKVVKRKQHSWNNWGIIDGFSSSKTKKQETEVTVPISKEQKISVEVKVDDGLSIEIGQSAGRGALKSVTKIEDESEKETLHIIEEVVNVGSAKKGLVTKKNRFWNNWGVIDGSSSSKTKKSETFSHEKVIVPVPKEQPDSLEVRVDELSIEPDEEIDDTVNETTSLITHSDSEAEITRTSSRKGLEILKSIVYGGLTESLASLSVVTSAASADAATLNIVALAIANLIGGLFALANNLKELKTEQPKTSNTEDETVVDQYTEVLGQRKNFILHTFIAILSFIIFGLIPPIVYGFTFRENDEKDFKLAAVAGASLLCITLLSVAKAYTKRPNSYITYFETVFYYVTTGGVATVLSYLAGDMVKKLIEKFGFFEAESSFGLKNQLGFGSY